MLGQFKDIYKLQKQAKAIKKKLNKMHIEAEYEGITVIINGEQEVIDVKINEAALTDPNKMQKNLVTCFNKAIKKSQQVGAEMMKDIMGDLNLPGVG